VHRYSVDAVRTAVVLFTRDLRVHDNPALHVACAAAERVVPLFVIDPDIRVSERRRRFLAECLADLRASLRDRGADLVIREGDPVAEAVKVAREVDAFVIATATDASAYAQRREQELERACAGDRLALKLIDSVTIVPPGRLRPAGGDHYRVFTPYWRSWLQHPWRAEVPAPQRMTTPDGIRPGRLPAAGRATGLMAGGETEACRRLAAWVAAADRYAERRNDLAGDPTSRLSPYLHFGCVSPLTVAARAGAATERSEEFLRQLCWRDFFHQVLRAFPALPRAPYRRAASELWSQDADALAAWQAGRTGVPVVDAGMRQLAAEGWLPGRARLITASYLTKHLGIDWRDGAAWFASQLLDADVANNSGNWQWVAGTGNDTKPYRRFSPARQAERYDPHGDYVRRWVPELAGVPDARMHRIATGRAGAERPG
jgi:deoxyribodipyrimidine photo-lyase